MPDTAGNTEEQTSSCHWVCYRLVGHVERGRRKAQRKSRESTYDGCKDFKEEEAAAWLLEDEWDFHRWRWGGQGFREKAIKM